MKKIETLVDDIYTFLDGKDPFSEEILGEFTRNMEHMLRSRLGPQEERKPYLRMSNLGKPCERQVWLQVNAPETAEELPPNVRLKFLYGDVIEELLLFLAKAAGHDVQGEQDRMELAGIVGHRDAVIDGVLVDVKSASSFSFQKFAKGDLKGDDPFGYIGQIQSYLASSQDDPLVTEKNRCAFLVMDKTLGHICLDIHEKVSFDVQAIAERKKEMIAGDMPNRTYSPEVASNGNETLPMPCGYCNVKHGCHKKLRGFAYAGGPKFFTKVVTQPRNRYGEIPEISLG